ncbi:MAG TPA: adenylate/guanylate cyclase domain-containing protein [Roseiarcus sp.]|jgi:adenylate cyclase
MPSLRQIRLSTGLVLFLYVTTHFVNHALGNISVEAMERGLVVQKLIWQAIPVALILYFSLFTHMSLGFWALYQRRRFRWTRLEATQLVLGLAIPFLLANHVIGTSVALTQFGIDKGYAQELASLWVGSPLLGALQAILLLIVWIHGCLGLHFWLRLKPFYPRVKATLLAVAVLLPALALLGYYQGGERTLVTVKDPGWRARNLSPEHVGTAAQSAALANERNATLLFLAAALAATLAARGFRRWREHRVDSVRLTYPDRTVRVARGFSVLEASLINAIPHAHVCGGRGRCSTCRIRILGGADGLPAPSAAEQAVLERVHAGPEVRLACQLRPTGDLAFVPLLSPYATTLDAYQAGAADSGVERYLVIMFVDMRGSSRLAERRLPFDTVFIINQFLNAVSHAVLDAGGQPNQVLGDGLLALFGMSDPPGVACRQAILASAAIADRVERLNDALVHALVEPIRFGIGIHAGVTVAGAIGYERHAQFTVIGDPVNVAARLQDLTKVIGCEVLISEEVYEHAGFGPDALPAHEVETRGRDASVKARSIARAADLAGLIAAQATAES